jgi:hypothetical protein
VHAFKVEALQTLPQQKWVKREGGRRRATASFHRPEAEPNFKNISVCLEIYYFLTFLTDWFMD